MDEEQDDWLTHPRVDAGVPNLRDRVCRLYEEMAHLEIELARHRRFCAYVQEHQPWLWEAWCSTDRDTH